MINTIELAIENRSILAFDYEGTLRFVEPHCVGRGTKGFLLRGFQTGGESDSINFGWKLFSFDKMSNVRLAPPRKGYKQGDRAMTEGIVAELSDVQNVL